MSAQLTKSRPLNVWYVLIASVGLMLSGTVVLLKQHPVQIVEDSKDVGAPAASEKTVARDLSLISSTARNNIRRAQVSNYLPYNTSGTMKRNNSLLIQKTDYIYGRPNDWDSAPIVLEEFKLIFFSIPKVGCTTFKQLFRRMMHLHDWKSQDPEVYMPHNPRRNGLKYLWDYSLEDASDLMTRPDYTRAIFVRDPKFRFLSAFLDKALGNFGGHIRNKCCKATGTCVEPGQTSEGFLKLIHNCSDSHWDPQTARMEAKYWKYINFVGHFEHLAEDGPALLKRIGAWNEYGTTGWGKHGNGSLFQTSASDQNHATGSIYKIWEWFTPALERKIEHYYRGDYAKPEFGYKAGLNLTKDFWIHGQDKIWFRGPWNGAPVVVEKYKLVFFTISRVGDTIWKQAFRRMQGLSDWNAAGGPKGLPHDPTQNNLTYLYDLDADYAEQIIKDPTWIKAVFIRNPKDRFLESFAFMKKNQEELAKQCCPIVKRCGNKAKSLPLFVNLTLTCESDQWELQTDRMEPKYWEYINFLGRMESIQKDSTSLLKKIGAWNSIGASGWGPDGTKRIFETGMDEEMGIKKVLGSYTPEIDRWLGEIYKKDLENERFGFPKNSTPILAKSS